MSDTNFSDEQQQFQQAFARLARVATQIDWCPDNAERFVDALTQARAELEVEIVDYLLWWLFACFMLERLPTPAQAVAMGVSGDEYQAMLRSVPREFWPRVEPKTRTLH